jgi:hypothetical protein
MTVSVHSKSLFARGIGASILRCLLRRLSGGPRQPARGKGAGGACGRVRRTLAARGLHVAATLICCVGLLRCDSSALYGSYRRSRSGRDAVASVHFAWNPVLVELRREVCPNARWQEKGRQWIMQDDEVRSFIRAAQARLSFQRRYARIKVNNVTWVVGFAQGAPYREAAAGT